MADGSLIGALWQTALTEYDLARVRIAVRLNKWVEKTAADVRGRRGRDFIGVTLDEIDTRATGRGRKEWRDANSTRARRPRRGAP